MERIDEFLIDYVFEKKDFDLLKQEIENNYSADNMYVSDIDKIETYLVNLSAEVYYEKYLIGKDLDYLVRKFHEEEMKIRFGRMVYDLDNRHMVADIWFKLLNDLDDDVDRGYLSEEHVDMMMIYLDDIYVRSTVAEALKIDQLKALLRDLEEGYDATSPDPGFNPFENIKAPKFRAYELLPLKRGRLTRPHKFRFYQRDRKSVV